MSIDKVPMVLIDLTQKFETGDASLILRCEGDYATLINTAASIMGMRQAELLRTLAIGGAKKIIEEAAR
jgi:uncharacterized protein (DUF1778 family)